MLGHDIQVQNIHSIAVRIFSLYYDYFFSLTIFIGLTSNKNQTKKKRVHGSVKKKSKQKWLNGCDRKNVCSVECSLCFSVLCREDIQSSNYVFTVAVVSAGLSLWNSTPRIHKDYLVSGKAIHKKVILSTLCFFHMNELNYKYQILLYNPPSSAFCI